MTANGAHEQRCDQVGAGLASERARRSTGDRIARAFGLTDDAWMRHANPLSVWTRFACVPLLVLAVWSRTWIGWYSLLAVAAAVAWTFVNPRFFSVPASTRSWASRAVLGERTWVSRPRSDLPAAFNSPVPNLANAYACVGAVSLVYGLVVLQLWPIATGLVIVFGGKLWYLDRMALLYDQLPHRDSDPHDLME